MLSPSDLLDTLDNWRDEGRIRQLDSAFPRFLAQLDPDAPAWLLLAAGVLVHMEGRGHSCLPLSDFVRTPKRVLAWSGPAESALKELWSVCACDLASGLQVLQNSRVVQDQGTGPSSFVSGEREGVPLVLAGPAHAPRLYLRRYWQYERDCAHHMAQAMQSRVPVDEALARTTLDSLFGVQGQNAPPSANAVHWQKLACALALRSRFSIITGGPGTGKTYTAARLLATLFATHPQPETLRVMLAAPTGKAAARLKQSIDMSLSQLEGQLPAHLALADLTARVGPARTLHALLGARVDTRTFKHHAANPLDVDVLIVDEASMVHLEMMVGLLDALPAHARLVLLGDKDQLASVEAGALLGDLCRRAQAPVYDPETRRYAQAVAGQILSNVAPSDWVPTQAEVLLAQHTVMLQTSHRFAGPIGQLAHAVNAGDGVQAQQVLYAPGDGAVAPFEGVELEQVIQMAVQGRAQAGGSYQDYCRLLPQMPDTHDSTDPALHLQWVKSVLKAYDGFRVLCAVREGPWGVEGLNRAIAQRLTQQGALQARGEWYLGRPVMVTRNEPALGVFNGDIGLVLPALPQKGQATRLRAWFLDGEQLRSVAVSRLTHVDTAFAMTVHKSQGSEYGHAMLVLPQHAGGTLTRELVYTGITRAKNAFTLLAQTQGLLTQAIEQRTQRASGLMDFLEDALCQ